MYYLLINIGRFTFVFLTLENFISLIMNVYPTQEDVVSNLNNLSIDHNDTVSGSKIVRVKKPDDVVSALSSVKDKECQTNPTTEASILQEIVENAELFQFLVAKKPDIIHKFYLMTK